MTSTVEPQPFATWARHVSNAPLLDRVEHRPRSILGVSTTKEVWSLNRKGTIVVYDSRDGEALVEFSSKGSIPRVAAEVSEYSEVWVGHCDGLVRAFSAKAPYSLIGDVCPAHSLSGGVHDMALGAAGGGEDASKTMFIACGDNNIIAVNIDSRDIVRKLQGHSGPVKALAIVRNVLFSAGEDRNVLQWDASDYSTDIYPMETFYEGEKEITALAISRQHLREAELLWVGTAAGTVKAINVNNGAVLETFRTEEAPVLSMHSIESAVYVLSPSPFGALRLDGTTMKELQPELPPTFKLPEDEERERQEEMEDGGSTARRFRRTPTRSICGSALIGVTRVGEVQLNVLCTLSAGTLSFIRQESTDRLSVECLLSRRRSNLETQLRKVRQLVADQEERLQIRVNPPEDVELQTALDKARKLEQVIVHSVQEEITSTTEFDENFTRRKAFEAWWILSVRRRVRRLTVRSERAAAQNNEVLRQSKFMQWELQARASMARKARERKVVALALRNNILITDKYFERLAQYRLQRLAAKRFIAASDTNVKGLLKRKLKQWMFWRLLSKKKRRLQTIADCFGRVTEQGVSHVYFRKWKCFNAEQQRQAAIDRFLYSLRSYSPRILAKLYFQRWAQFQRMKHRQRLFDNARILLLKGFSSVHRKQYFHTWQKFLHQRKHRGAIQRTTNLLNHVFSHGVMKIYYIRWRQFAKVVLADRQRTIASRRAKSFVRLTRMYATERQYYRKWVLFLRGKRREHRQNFTAESLLQATASGQLRVAYHRWCVFMVNRQREKQRELAHELLMANCDAGLSKIYYGKWAAFHKHYRRQVRDKQVFAVMSTYHTTITRSKYFQTWLNKALLKRRLNLQLAMIDAPKNDELERYFKKWMLFIFPTVIRRRRRVERAVEQLDTEEQQLTEKLEECKRAISTKKWALQDMIEKRTETEVGLQQSNQQALESEVALQDIRQKNEKKNMKLNKASDRLDAYRSALAASRDRPPVKAACEWYRELKNVEGYVKQLRAQLAVDSKPVPDHHLDARLEEVARMTIAAHKELETDLETLKIVTRIQEEEEKEEKRELQEQEELAQKEKKMVNVGTRQARPALSVTKRPPASKTTQLRPVLVKAHPTQPEPSGLRPSGVSSLDESALSASPIAPPSAAVSGGTNDESTPDPQRQGVRNQPLVG